jgi:hypothetical protein
MRKIFSHKGFNGQWCTIYADKNKNYFESTINIQKKPVDIEYVRMAAWHDLNRNMKRVPTNSDVDIHISY